MSKLARLLCGAGIVVTMLPGCGNSPQPPSIDNIDNASTPASPVGVAIEINGSHFLGTPGSVRFAQGGNAVSVTPDAAGWSDGSILVNVPSDGAAGAFVVPGTVTVTVTTSAGTSNGITLDLVEVPVFNNGDVQWATTTPLPTPLRGLRAAAVKATATTGWVFVVGGNDGTNNLADVLSNSIAQDGQLGKNWTSTTVLPAPRAHEGLAAAHDRNSPVPSGSAYLYVVGGQAAQAEAPGGTDTVFVGTVSLADGTIASWRAGRTLPEPLVGPTVVLYNGYLYVACGLRPDGSSSDKVYSAKVYSNGDLGPWATAPAPEGLSFATGFAFGGRLYLMGGDADGSTDPNEQGSGEVSDAWSATARDGAVGLWTVQTQLGKRRQKHVVWFAFGQVLSGEGVYPSSVGSQELERNVIDANGDFSSWNSISSTSNQAGANVYNAAALVSPIRPTNGGPRFLLLGGQAFVSSPPGALSDVVYYNTAP